MYQPDLESLLDRAARGCPNVTVHRGCQVVGLVLDDTGVTLDVRSATNDRTDEFQVRARYVVGADGANSAVRKLAGLGWEDLGFHADWLVVDFRLNEPDSQLDMPHAGQVCDPARPVTLIRYLGRFHARWEFMLLPGETAEEMKSEERVWSLLSRWVGPQDGAIVRRAVYTFRSGLAVDWHRQRVIIAGDAAHLMPPFIGQGMCSGIRDAHNMTWRLDLVLRGAASNDAFADYTHERKRHVRGIIDLSVALGKIVCVTDPRAAAARDQDILAGRAPPLPPFPHLHGGTVKHGRDGAPLAPAGLLSPQGRVRVGPQTALFDHFFGVGWRLITRSDALGRDVRARDQRIWERLGGRTVILGNQAHAGDAVDADKTYAEFFDAHNVDALIVRPDFYVYGAIGSGSDFCEAMDDIAGKLGALRKAETNAF
jgi:2-polyprenyl-6-methoxyphenol hydroxylase-like FAD-dependent oxidoreductase